MTTVPSPPSPAVNVPAAGSPAAGTPAAAVRTRVTVPLRFPDGYATTAEVITFTGLVDGKEHLALALGDPGRAAVPLVRAHSTLALPLDPPFPGDLAVVVGDLSGSGRWSPPQVQDRQGSGLGGAQWARGSADRNGVKAV